MPSESEAVPSSAGYYSAEMGGVDDPVIEVLRRSTGGEDGIRDALRYLDALDKFYGEAGRPRLVNKNNLNSVHFSTPDRYYDKHSMIPD